MFKGKADQVGGHGAGGAAARTDDGGTDLDHGGRVGDDSAGGAGLADGGTGSGIDSLVGAGAEPLQTEDDRRDDAGAAADLAAASNSDKQWKDGLDPSDPEPTDRLQLAVWRTRRAYVQHLRTYQASLRKDRRAIREAERELQAERDRRIADRRLALGTEVEQAGIAPDDLAQLAAVLRDSGLSIADLAALARRPGAS